jgi:hypothetical protein
MFTHTFTDIHGNTHTDAIIVITQANFNCNENSFFRLEEGSGDLANAERTERANTNNSMSFNAAYWPDQASIDAGDTPVILQSDVHWNFVDGVATGGVRKPFERTNSFDVNNLPVEYMALSVEKKAEKFLIDTI